MARLLFGLQGLLLAAFLFLCLKLVQVDDKDHLLVLEDRVKDLVHNDQLREVVIDKVIPDFYCQLLTVIYILLN